MIPIRAPEPSTAGVLKPTQGDGPRPELELLLCCARTRLDVVRSERVRALIGGGIDWERLLRMAGQHGLTPLLHRHLGAPGTDVCPPAIMDRLRVNFAENTRRNLFMTGELLKVLARARERGLSLIAYKGPALTLMAYGHLGLREFSDLDVLVHPEGVAQLGEILGSQGYEPAVWPGDARWSVYRRVESTLPFHRRAPDATIEVHWRLTPRYFRFPRDPRSVWGDLASVAMSSQQITTFSPETTLLFLAVHGAKHHWSRLGWICDLLCLIENAPPLDWEKVLRHASEEHCRRMLFIGLLLAKNLLGAAIPGGVDERMREDQVASRLAAAIHQRFLKSPDYQDRSIARGLFLLRCWDRFRDRVRCGVNLALSPNEGDLMALSLPAPLAPLYCLVRPVRLVGRYGFRLFRRPDRGNSE